SPHWWAAAVSSRWAASTAGSRVSSRAPRAGSRAGGLTLLQLSWAAARSPIDRSTACSESRYWSILARSAPARRTRRRRLSSAMRSMKLRLVARVWANPPPEGGRQIEVGLAPAGEGEVALEEAVARAEEDEALADSALGAQRLGDELAGDGAQEVAAGPQAQASQEVAATEDVHGFLLVRGL